MTGVAYSAEALRRAWNGPGESEHDLPPYPAFESRLGCTYVRETDDRLPWDDREGMWIWAVKLQLILDRARGLR